MTIPETIAKLRALWAIRIKDFRDPKQSFPTSYERGSEVKRCLVELLQALSQPDNGYNTARDIAIATTVMGWKALPDGNQEEVFAEDASLPYVIEYAERCVLMFGPDHEDWEVWSPTGNHEHALEAVDAIEARESEKPREWWTVGERKPPDSKTVLHWRAGRWMKSYLHNDKWELREDGFGVRESLSSDIWRLMPEAPVIREGKS